MNKVKDPFRLTQVKVMKEIIIMLFHVYLANVLQQEIKYLNE